MSRAENGSVPLWWVIVFVLLALGLGAYAITSSGGSLVDSAAWTVPLLH